MASEQHVYPWSVQTPDGQVISGRFDGDRPLSKSELLQAVADEVPREAALEQGEG